MGYAAWMINQDLVQKTGEVIDSLSAADENQAIARLLGVLDDGVSAADSNLSIVSRVAGLSDSAQIADQSLAIAHLTEFRTDEEVSAGDPHACCRTLIEERSDGLSSSDAASASQGSIGVLIDTISALDSSVTIARFLGVVSEGMGGAGDEPAIRQISESSDDSGEASDLAEATYLAAVELFDQMDSSDAFANTVHRIVSRLESGSFANLREGSQADEGSLTSVMGPTDSAQGLVRALGDRMDGVSVGDALVGLVAAIGANEDELSASESRTGDVRRYEGVLAEAGLSDALEAARHISTWLDEGFQVSDQSETITHIMGSRFDAVGLSEAASGKTKAMRATATFLSRATQHIVMKSRASTEVLFKSEE